MRLTGGSIAYTLAGAGPALLLIHGLGGTRKTWRHLIDDLARTHTVIAPDLPGHGESDPPAGDYSLGAHACVLRDLILCLGYRRFSVAGHSLGGGIALQTAYQFPERIDRLLLISSGGLGPEVSYALRAATLPGADPVIAALSALPTALTRRAMATVPGLVSGPDAGQIADVLSGLRDSKQRIAFIRTARSVIDWRGQAVSAQRQTGLLHGVPVLLAWGAADTTIPPDHHRAFATRVPVSRDGRDRRRRTLSCMKPTAPSCLSRFRRFCHRRCLSSTPRSPGLTGSPRRHPESTDVAMGKL